jgi:hypothetical protein
MVMAQLVTLKSKQSYHKGHGEGLPILEWFHLQAGASGSLFFFAC